MNKQQKEMVIEKVTKAVVAKYEVAKCFKELLERNATHQQNINQKISIDIGRKNDEGFLSFLHSSFKNPLVTIQYCDNEPQLKVSSFDKSNGGSVVLNLTMMENIQIKEKRSGTDFLTYDIGFHYSPANMDYSIQVVVR